MANETLSKAKVAKNDEFYTQYHDIEREVEAYLEYNPDVFRNKTVLLPCDDPEWSNFTRYFAQNFERLGLKKLISTSYAYESKKYKGPIQLTLFETDAPQFDAGKTQTHGKIFVLTHDTNGNGRVDIEDLQWQYLEGDGDFRSKEVTRLRDEADIIVTNPPFSLFRQFLAWIVEAEKQFLIIGNQNAITYKEVFPLIKENKLWLGKGFKGGAAHFISNYKDYATAGDHREGMIRVSGVVWFSNIEHGRRHQPLQLMTMADNLKYSKHKEIKG
ncbi:MAG: DNA methyltransferase, partial [Bacteroidaceae bacterium]|nr:DNA methyltransferase [Bacteroidaceae bacterium]